jgi:hypothetical protein
VRIRGDPVAVTGDTLRTAHPGQSLPRSSCGGKARTGGGSGSQKTNRHRKSIWGNPMVKGSGGLGIAPGTLSFWGVSYHFKRSCIKKEPDDRKSPMTKRAHHSDRITGLTGSYWNSLHPENPVIPSFFFTFHHPREHGAPD